MGPIGPIHVQAGRTLETSRLEFKGVSKRFGPVQALDDVSFAVAPGKVHGLLGENGAGKSTLLKCLSGVYVPDNGEISVDGAVLSLTGPLSARNAGIAMIHQELQHVPEMSVAQNLFLGRPIRKLGACSRIVLRKNRRPPKSSMVWTRPLTPVNASQTCASRNASLSRSHAP